MTNGHTLPRFAFNGLHFTHLLTPKRWKLAWLVDPQRTLYPRSGHMWTIGQA